MPAGHSRHSPKPVDGAKVPGRHGWQADDAEAPCAADAVPTGQKVHAETDVAASMSPMLPAAHGKHPVSEATPVMAL